MHRESGGQTRKLSWTTTYGEDIANVCSVPGVSTTGVCKDPSKQPKDKIADLVCDLSRSAFIGRYTLKRSIDTDSIEMYADLQKFSAKQVF